MQRVWIVVLAGACGGGGGEGNLVASTRFVLGERSGSGPSPLDVLDGQEIAFEVELVAVVIGHETVQACQHTVSVSAMPITTATGAQASIVETEILKPQPWDLRLALCEPASDSALTLHTEGAGGVAVIAGCADVPASAQLRDADGYPQLSSFTASDCDGRVYDQPHDRLFMAHAFELTVTQ